MANVPYHTHDFTIPTASSADIDAGNAGVVVTPDVLKPWCDANFPLQDITSSKVQPLKAPQLVVGNTIKWRLSAPLSLYVRPDGNDANNGRANTPDGAFREIYQAVNYACDWIDNNGFSIYIYVADGTYNYGVDRNVPQTGGGGIYVLGNKDHPENCIINYPAGNGFKCYWGAQLYVEGFTIICGGRGIYTAFGGHINFNNINFGDCGSYHLRASGGYLWGRAITGGPAQYTVSGSAPAHYSAHSNGVIYTVGVAVTVVNNPTFATAFAIQSTSGAFEMSGAVITGAATGVRFYITDIGCLSYTGNILTLFPGTIKGSFTAPYDPQKLVNAVSIANNTALAVDLSTVPTASISIFTFNVASGPTKGTGNVPRGQIALKQSSPYIDTITMDLTNVTLTTGTVLTGTTGTSGKWTISVVSGTLYIENRAGGTYFISVRWNDL